MRGGWKYLIRLWLMGLFLVSCGGEETGTGVDDPGPDPAGNHLAIGTISEFGSIYVNGIKFDTTTTQVTIENNSSAVSALELGMVAQVQGTINNDNVSGKADSVAIEYILQGVVESNDLNNTISLLGYDVQITDATVFASNVVPGVISSLSVGTSVDISGYIKTGNIISATRIQINPGLTDFKLKGMVGSIDNANMMFTIGALSVNYLNAILENFTGQLLQEGQLVSVRGTLDIAGILIATDVKFEKLVVENTDKIEIEGYVNTASLPLTQFYIGNVQVQIQAGTRYVGGLAEDIITGVYIEVEGSLSNSILLAKEIQFKDNIKLQSLIASIDPDLGQLTLLGLPGVVVQTDGLTEFKKVVGLLNLNVDENVIIRGLMSGQGNTIIATLVELKAGDDTLILQGPISLLADPIVGILGVNVDTSDIDEADFVDKLGQTGRLNFFTTVQLTDLVKSKGFIDLTTNNIIWESLQSE